MMFFHDDVMKQSVNETGSKLNQNKNTLATIFLGFNYIIMTVRIIPLSNGKIQRFGAGTTNSIIY